MNEPLRVFIGWDSREPAAFAVCAHSILTRSNAPIAITALTQQSLRRAGLYAREKNLLESTEFSFSRFLVPALCGFEGTAIFMDCDFLVRAEIGELFAYPIAYPDAAVHVCQHDYTPKDTEKFLGAAQTAYPRKNWSSLMVFNNEKCCALTPDYVNSATGLELHRLLWANEAIGSIPLEWNYLVGEYPPTSEAKAFHYTLGGVWHGAAYNDGPEAALWRDEFRTMAGAETLKALGL